LGRSMATTGGRWAVKELERPRRLGGSRSSL
jgi:hypothetical protein